MSISTMAEIEVWEGEGGAAVEAPADPVPAMRGSKAQVEWAERIRRVVNAEFDRVAAVLRAVGKRQRGARRMSTEAILVILEDKRAEVMSRNQAGYFIREWQEISGQVRQLIFEDARYKAMRHERLA
ncbi:MAG: hypothetical protein IPM24_25560 [Bryobacterales bacterium]|nr:hypothetical protein [Bryobacterales bacterium]